MHIEKEYICIGSEYFNELAALQISYKAEIGEEKPSEQELECLKRAIEQGLIHFYGCVCEGKLVACCSVCVTYSTFNYEKAGVFEDFYIKPEFRHQGIAKKLVAYAYKESQVKSLTVGCADCDVEMYQVIGFSIPLGNMLAFNA